MAKLVIGNTAEVRRKHYHGGRQEDWIKAVGNPAPNPAPSTPVTSHQEPSTLHGDREKSLEVRKKQRIHYSRQGSNL